MKEENQDLTATQSSDQDARLDVLVPLDALTSLPPSLDGSQGAFRNRSTPCLLGADNDLQAVHEFLDGYHDSPTTYRTYRKELERLVLWSLKEAGKPLSSLNHADMLAYQTFLEDPGSDWVGPRAARYLRDGSPNPDWRPFIKGLTPKSRKMALGIIHTFLGWLVTSGYLSANPLALVRNRNKAVHMGADRTGHERIFDVIQMDAIWQALDGMVEGAVHPDERKEAERLLFIVNVLYYLGLRVGELTSHTMADFIEVRNKWWFRVVGKGGREEDIPIHPTLLVALIRFRKSLGLSLYPGSSDQRALAPMLKGSRSIGDRMVNVLLHRLFSRAAALIESDHPLKAESLRHGSAHWMRHTSATHQLDAGIDLKSVQKNMRHRKFETTAGYLHVEDDARHEEIRKLTPTGSKD